MSSTISPLAGKPLDPSLLVDLARLGQAYFERPNPADPAQRVAFGTSGHRGSSLLRSFNEAHILAISASIGGSRASTARSSSASTPMPCRARPSRPRWRSSPPMA